MRWASEGGENCRSEVPERCRTNSRALLDVMKSDSEGSAFYMQDPDRFCDSAEQEQLDLREKLQNARDNLSSVQFPSEVQTCVFFCSRHRYVNTDLIELMHCLRSVLWTEISRSAGAIFDRVLTLIFYFQVKLQISEICSLLNVDGIRGDIVTNRAARALVAFEGRDTVSMDDVKRIIGVCVNHR